MSRQRNCWDAVAESFFATLKAEPCHRQQFQTRDEARQAIFEYIEVFYNRERLHPSRLQESDPVRILAHVEHSLTMCPQNWIKFTDAGSEFTFGTSYAVTITTRCGHESSENKKPFISKKG